MSTPIDLASRRRGSRPLRGPLATFTKTGPMPAEGDHLYFVKCDGIAYSSGDTGEIKSVKPNPDGSVRFILVDGTILSIAPNTVIQWEPKP